MKTILICHDDSPFDHQCIARWMASFSSLEAIIIIHEPKNLLIKRIKSEIRRVGLIRFLDVLAFKLYYKLVLSKSDNDWINQQILNLQHKYKELPENVPLIFTDNPNNDEIKNMIQGIKPDIIIARCKLLLKKEIHTLAAKGTLVIHPGICPQYRNAHGCFWALANRDLNHVGATLLQIDEGIDTGPVYGYFYYPFDEVHESHIKIQYRALIENLDNIQAKILEINESKAQTLDTRDKASKNYGQVWMTKYIKWRWAVMKYNTFRNKATTLLYHDIILNNQYEESGFLGKSANKYKLDYLVFKKQLEAIRNQTNIKPIRVTEIDQRSENQPDFMFTFDDGGKSALLIADLLDQYQWKAHFFITTDYINTPGFLTEADIKDLHQRGHIIGSHSCSHPKCISSLDEKYLLDEWTSSLNRLSNICDAPILTASVPGGYYSKKVAETAAESGIKWLFTSEPIRTKNQVKECTVLGRFCILKETKNKDVVKIISEDRWVQYRMYLIWNIKKLLKRLAGK